MIRLKLGVDTQKHIEKVNAAINRTASCGGSVKSNIIDTSLLEERFYIATLSPAMEAFLQKDPDVKILEQDRKVSLSRSVPVRRPATRRSMRLFRTYWCVCKILFITIPELTGIIL
jgi:hypothetical protein